MMVVMTTSWISNIGMPCDMANQPQSTQYQRLHSMEKSASSMMTTRTIADSVTIAWSTKTSTLTVTMKALRNNASYTMIRDPELSMMTARNSRPWPHTTPPSNQKKHLNHLRKNPIGKQNTPPRKLLSQNLFMSTRMHKSFMKFSLILRRKGSSVMNRSTFQLLHTTNTSAIVSLLLLL